LLFSPRGPLRPSRRDDLPDVPRPVRGSADAAAAAAPRPAPRRGPRGGL